MSVWTDRQLWEWAQRGGITPFDPSVHTTWIGSADRLINPASIDLRLGNTARRLRLYADPPMLDYGSTDADVVWEKKIVFSELILNPNEVALLTTAEFVRIPQDAAGLLFLKSSAGRKGLEHLHCLAGDTLIDCPYRGDVPISELANDRGSFYVRAYNQDSGEFVIAPATAFRARTNASAVRVHYELVNDVGGEKSIVCTPDHRFLTLDGRWVEAKDACGETLRSVELAYRQLVRRRVVLVEDLSELLEQTYDISVPNYENFVANGVVVHNSGFADPKFPGELTLEVVNLSGVSWRLRPGDRLMQLAIFDTNGDPINNYEQTGRYVGQVGATAFQKERDR